MTTSVLPVTATDVDGCARGCVWTDDAGTAWPSEATHGRLCSWCYARLDDHLRMAGAAVELLRDGVVPGIPARTYADRVTGSRVMPLPFDAGAAALAAEVVAVVSGWAGEAHRLTGIGAPLVVRDRAAAGVPLGSLRGVDGAAARALVEAHAGWMRRHLQSIAYLDAVPVIHDEVVPVVRRAVRRCGVRVPAMHRGRCPVCLTRSVEVVWVAGTRDVPTGLVRCGRCGWSSERWSAVTWRA